MGLPSCRGRRRDPSTLLTRKALRIASHTPTPGACCVPMLPVGTQDCKGPRACSLRSQPRARTNPKRIEAEPPPSRLVDAISRPPRVPGSSALLSFKPAGAFETCSSVRSPMMARIPHRATKLARGGPVCGQAKVRKRPAQADQQPPSPARAAPGAPLHGLGPRAHAPRAPIFEPRKTGAPCEVRADNLRQSPASTTSQRDDFAGPVAKPELTTLQASLARAMKAGHQ